MTLIRNTFIVFLLLSSFVVSQTQELPQKQRSVAERFSQLEQILLRMSEASSSSNPRRAELLKKVLFSSKDKLVALRLEKVVNVLERRQLTEAISGQEEIEKDLLELLQLLESENRDQRRDLEKEKIKEFLRDLEEIIHQEKALKARTSQEENEKLSPLEKDQRDVRLRAQSLRDRISENENPDDKSSEVNEDNKEKSDDMENTGKDSKKPEKDEQNDETKDDDKKEETGKDESPQKSSESKVDEENKKTSETQQKDEESSNDSPTQQAMKKALDRMKQAEQKLQKAEKSGALEDQEEVIAELQRAKAELEKILRQIREEEMLQTLEKLEARLKRMLRIEQSIRSQTEKISVTMKEADEAALRQIRIQASRLSADQQSVLDDADAALILLREDGTAQAMVESLLQTRFDMEEIKGRLELTQLDTTTIGIEDAVIAALQEMLEAVDMAIKEAEKRKENPPPPDGADGNAPDEEPLIQLLSELKMIRSMQRRVNERTERCEKAIEELRNESNTDLEALRKRVEELARQQNRISRILHDLKVGKAK